MIDRQLAKEISAEIKEALQAVATSYDMELVFKGVTFDGNTVRPRCEFKAADAMRNEFSMYAPGLGLDQGDFGRRFVSKGRTFEITGVSPRSPKRPILCREVATGRNFKFPPSSVKFGLARAKAE